MKTKAHGRTKGQVAKGVVALMFDALVLLVIGISTALAVLLGGLREIAVLVALAAAAFVTFLVAEPLIGMLGASGSTMTSLIVALGTFGVSFLVLHLLTYLGLRQFPLEGNADLINRIAGGIYGFVRGIALVGIFFLGYSYYLDEDRQPESVRNAFTQPMANSVAKFFEGLAPASTQVDLSTDERDAEARNSDNTQTTAALENSAGDGYDRASRAGLSAMITTVTTTEGAQSTNAASATALRDGSASANGDPIATILNEDQ